LNTFSKYIIRFCFPKCIFYSIIAFSKWFFFSNSILELYFQNIKIYFKFCFSKMYLFVFKIFNSTRQFWKFRSGWVGCRKNWPLICQQKKHVWGLQYLYEKNPMDQKNIASTQAQQKHNHVDSFFLHLHTFLCHPHTKCENTILSFFFHPLDLK